MGTPAAQDETRALADRLIEVVEAHRRHVGLSVAALARAMGVQQSTLARQLHGSGDLTIDEWSALARALGVQLSTLIVLVEG